MRTAACILAGILLSGCVSPETVHLANQSGRIVQCGPYNAPGIGLLADLTVQQKIRDCVADFQRQGFERTPN